MATATQLAANRANAQLSTGPRTGAGKAASSQNARKHGLSSQYLPLSDAERPLFEQLEAGLRAEVLPKGPLQESIFRELTAAAWKRDVVCRLLAEAGAGASSDLLFADEIPARVRKLLRHKADQDRAFNRALRQLKELQTTDQLRRALIHAHATQTAGVDASNYPGLADYRKITKQTQSQPAHFQNLSAEELETIRKQNEEARRELRRRAEALHCGIDEPLAA